MSAIRMSSGFGSSGQKRTPEKVVMEPSESIHPKNHAGYTRHNSTLLLLLQGAQEPLPSRPTGGASGVVVGSAACRLGGTDHDSGATPPLPGARGAETGPANLRDPRREGPRSAAKLLLFWAAQEQDNVPSRSPAL